MFLWVSLIIDDLQKSTTTRPRIIREKLKSLPKTLPDLYTNILSKIKSDDQEYATAIFRWVVWAMRPLTLQELTIAIAIRSEDTSISLDRFYWRSSQHRQEHLLLRMDHSLPC
jgi:hypothetical protein